MTGDGPTLVNEKGAVADAGHEPPIRERESNAELKAAGLKHCSGCDQIKPRTEFSPNGVSPKGVVYVAKLCKPCNAGNERDKRAADPKPMKVLRTDIPPEEMTAPELRNVGLKRCSICREIKSRDQFSVSSASDGSLSGGCKPCEAAKARARRAADPAKYRLRDNEPKRQERKRARAREKAASAPRNLCDCGCGGETQRRFVRGHHRRMPDDVPPRPAQGGTAEPDGLTRRSDRVLEHDALGPAAPSSHEPKNPGDQPCQPGGTGQQDQRHRRSDAPTRCVAADTEGVPG